MSSDRLPETNRIRKIAGFFKAALLHLSRAPSPSSIKMDSSSDNPTSVSPLNMVPVVSVDHVPTPAFATETCTLSPGLVPVSGSISVSKQLGSTSSRGLETPLTTSLATHSPLSPSLPDAIIQVSSESEQRLPIQGSGSDGGGEYGGNNGWSYSFGKWPDQVQQQQPQQRAQVIPVQSPILNPTPAAESVNVRDWAKDDDPPSRSPSRLPHSRRSSTGNRQAEPSNNNNFPSGSRAPQADPTSAAEPVNVRVKDDDPPSRSPSSLPRNSTGNRQASDRGLETPPTHMSLATNNPLSPSLPDPIIQVSTESEQNLSIQGSGSGGGEYGGWSYSFGIWPNQVQQQLQQQQQAQVIPVQFPIPNPTPTAEPVKVRDWVKDDDLQVVPLPLSRRSSTGNRQAEPSNNNNNFLSGFRAPRTDPTSAAEPVNVRDWVKDNDPPSRSPSRLPHSRRSSTGNCQAEPSNNNNLSSSPRADPTPAAEPVNVRDWVKDDDPSTRSPSPLFHSGRSSTGNRQAEPSNNNFPSGSRIPRVDPYSLESFDRSINSVLHQSHHRNANLAAIPSNSQPVIPLTRKQDEIRRKRERERQSKWMPLSGDGDMSDSSDEEPSRRMPTWYPPPTTAHQPQQQAQVSFVQFSTPNPTPAVVNVRDWVKDDDPSSRSPSPLFHSGRSSTGNRQTEPSNNNNNFPSGSRVPRVDPYSLESFDRSINSMLRQSHHRNANLAVILSNSSQRVFPLTRNQNEIPRKREREPQSKWIPLSGLGDTSDSSDEEPSWYPPPTTAHQPQQAQVDSFQLPILNPTPAAELVNIRDWVKDDGPPSRSPRPLPRSSTGNHQAEPSNNSFPSGSRAPRADPTSAAEPVNVRDWAKDDDPPSLFPSLLPRSRRSSTGNRQAKPWNNSGSRISRVDPYSIESFDRSINSMLHQSHRRNANLAAILSNSQRAVPIIPTRKQKEIRKNEVRKKRRERERQSKWIPLSGDSDTSDSSDEEPSWYPPPTTAHQPPAFPLTHFQKSRQDPPNPHLSHPSFTSRPAPVSIPPPQTSAVLPIMNHSPPQSLGPAQLAQYQFEQQYKAYQFEQQHKAYQFQKQQQGVGQQQQQQYHHSQHSQQSWQNTVTGIVISG